MKKTPEKHRPRRRKARRLLVATGAGLLLSACGFIGPMGNLAPPMDMTDIAQPDGPFGNLAAPDLASTPDTAMPDAAMPDMAMPDAPFGNLAAPDLTTDLTSTDGSKD